MAARSFRRYPSARNPPVTARDGYMGLARRGQGDFRARHRGRDYGPVWRPGSSKRRYSGQAQGFNARAPLRIR